MLAEARFDDSGPATTGPESSKPAEDGYEPPTLRLSRDWRDDSVMRAGRNPLQRRNLCICPARKLGLMLGWGFAADQWRGSDHLVVLLSHADRVVRCLIGLLAVLVRSDLSKDGELLVQHRLYYQEVAGDDRVRVPRAAKARV